MENGELIKRAKVARQRFFVARELQLSIAMMVVAALLGGVFLESLGRAIVEHYGLKTQALVMVLVSGYVLLIAVLSLIFTHRLIGPFKRLEHEMRLIKAGALEKRLGVRYKDDLHVRNFVEHVNDMISSFEETRRQHGALNAALAAGLARLNDAISRSELDEARSELKNLQVELHKFKEK